MENQKLYVVVRSDLPPGGRCAQSCHAAVAFVLGHAEIARSWHESSNNLVILECPSEAELLELARRSEAEAVPV